MTITDETLDIEDTTRREFIAGAAAISLLFLAGCGDDGDGDGADGGTRVVEDAFGKTEIPIDPQRVIADSVSTYAHLVSLGITPIAVALPIGISPEYISDDADEMANVVAGDGWTINVELAKSMNADLIVAIGADYNEDNCKKYREALPTFSFVEIWNDGAAQDTKDTLVGLALALGREDEAAAAIAAFDAQLASTRTRVADAGLAGTRVGIVRFDATGFIGIRIDHSANGLLADLGMVAPEWDGEDVDGYIVLSLETLGVLDAADLLIINTDDDVVIDNVEALNSPLWAELAVVKEDRIRFASAWNGADLPQLVRMLDDIERELILPAEADA